MRFLVKFDVADLNYATRDYMNRILTISTIFVAHGVNILNSPSTLFVDSKSE